MRVPRPSASMVVASAALLVAVGGTGYAAVTLPRNSVGTKQLAANAVTGAKVRNGSLRAEDFARGQLPAGARGERGAQGDRGPSDAFAAGTENPVVLPDTGTPAPVASLTLAPGSYVILAGGGIEHSSGGEAFVSCALAAGGAGSQNQTANVFGPGGGPTSGLIAMRAVRTYTAAATVSLTCLDHRASTTGDANLVGPQLIAIRVATLTGP